MDPASASTPPRSADRKPRCQSLAPPDCADQTPGACHPARATDSHRSALARHFPALFPRGQTNLAAIPIRRCRFVPPPSRLGRQQKVPGPPPGDNQCFAEPLPAHPSLRGFVGRTPVPPEPHREGTVDIPARRMPHSSWPQPEISDRKSSRLNSSHQIISYAVFCLKKKKAPSHDQL